MTATKTPSTPPLVLVTASDGISLIPAESRLTRLNYFDGKFLRAEDLEAEQRYLRYLVELGNQAGGTGVVHGLDLSLSGDKLKLKISAGLAIDPAGRAIWLPKAESVPVTDLIEASRGLTASSAAASSGSAETFEPCAEPSVDTVEPMGQHTCYLITVTLAEALCGEEDVYGSLCEQACVTTTDRPYRVEGALLRARPLILSLPPSPNASEGDLQSRLASAYFADEASWLGAPGSPIPLGSKTWCAGAIGSDDGEVRLGVLVRKGGIADFVDQWIARRERMDAPSKRYWQKRMGMRPWNVYLAQILQFQCQLREVLGGEAIGGWLASCKEAGIELATVMEDINKVFPESSGEAAPEAVTEAGEPASEESAGTMIAVDKAKAIKWKGSVESAQKLFEKASNERSLLELGIVELPSAGYLSVDPFSDLSVEEQVRYLFSGTGVDLYFRPVRPDFVPHALEEAQHLERIALQGHERPQVNILVPHGHITPERSGTDTVRSVYGPLDWVLFHRCRDGTCEEDVPTAPVETETTTCHEVYRLTPIQSEALDDILENRNVGELISNSGNSYVDHLGTLYFQVPGSEPVPEHAATVLGGWSAKNRDCPPAEVYSYRHASQDSSGDQLIAEQGSKIASVLGNTDVKPTVLVADEIPADCPVVTLVRPSAICVRVRQRTANEDYNIPAILGIIQDQNVQKLIDISDQQLGDLYLCPETLDIFGGDVSKLAQPDYLKAIGFAWQSTILSEENARGLIQVVRSRLGVPDNFDDDFVLSMPEPLDNFSWDNTACSMLVFVVMA